MEVSRGSWHLAENKGADSNDNRRGTSKKQRQAQDESGATRGAGHPARHDDHVKEAEEDGYRRDDDRDLLSDERQAWHHDGQDDHDNEQEQGDLEEITALKLSRERLIRHDGCANPSCAQLALAQARCFTIAKTAAAPDPSMMGRQSSVKGWLALPSAGTMNVLFPRATFVWQLYSMVESMV